MMEGMALELADAVLGADAAAVLSHFRKNRVGHRPFPLGRPAPVGACRTRHVVMQVAVAKMAEYEKPAVGRHRAQPLLSGFKELRNALDRQRNVVFEVGTVGSLCLGDLFT